MATTLANVDGLQVPLVGTFMAAAMIFGAVGWWPGLLCMLCPVQGLSSAPAEIPRRGGTAMPVADRHPVTVCWRLT